MKIQVKLFASLRERAGLSEFYVELPAGATVADAAEAIGQRFSALRVAAARTAYAVNLSYVKAEAVLSDGDELALIPPVSGG